MGSKMNLDTKCRFESKINKTDTCWLWTAGVNNKGYGYFGFNSTVVGAHRVAYELYIGPIPDKLYVLHSCDNPPCVNPKHLFLGTSGDNMGDMMRKGRQSKYHPRKGKKKQSKGRFKKIGREDKLEIIRLYTERKITQETISNMYNVSQTTISYILHGRNQAIRLA